MRVRLHAWNSLSGFCALGSKRDSLICRSGVECAAKPAVATNLRVRCILHACLALLRLSVRKRACAFDPRRRAHHHAQALPAARSFFFAVTVVAPRDPRTHAFD